MGRLLGGFGRNLSADARGSPSRRVKCPSRKARSGAGGKANAGRRPGVGRRAGPVLRAAEGVAAGLRVCGSAGSAGRRRGGFSPPPPLPFPSLGAAPPDPRCRPERPRP
ncbi:hypothetical protein GTY23_22585, partial [Streptomyces sp. SID5998]|nr:hypothetical protein [Streptomyces sp. SID5998]